MANHGCMVVTLRPQPNHPNGNIQKSEDRTKARQVRSNGKVLLTVCFDCIGMVHHEFLTQGCTPNKEFYLEVMGQAIRLKCTELWKNNQGFVTMIMHQLRYHACSWNFGQKQNRKHASTTVFTGLGPRLHLPLLKTEDFEERKTFCYD